MRQFSILFGIILIYSVSSAQLRSFDGSNNNLSNTDWGKAEGSIIRVTSNAYSDSISSPAGTQRPNPRLVSNLIFDQQLSIPNSRSISDFGWAWGQFIDHDITFVDDNQAENIDIPVPAFDPFFDPKGTGTKNIRMRRSKSDPLTGTSTSNPRAQINGITAWIDASTVYGSDSIRAKWLRAFNGGKLKMSNGNLLPFNTTTGEYSDPIDSSAPPMIIEGVPRPKYFVAGDIRANEQPILTCLHTLFVREHNSQCDQLAIAHPTWNDAQLYHYARASVIGIIQQISFGEWLPKLGIQIPAYQGYNSSMNPNIMNVFSAAAYRLGHTLISGDLKRLDGNGKQIPQGHLTLKNAFFDPSHVMQVGLEPFFKGLATQKQENFDTKVIGDLRNFLFGAPGAGGLDLVAININRGRERGLTDYNRIRVDMGMSSLSTFADITSDASLASLLQGIYGSVNNVDPWVGMLAEDHVSGSAVGATVKHILEEQFQHLRDGDRFYFEGDPQLHLQTIASIKSTTLSQVIKRNSTIQILQDNVFHATQHDSIALQVSVIEEDFLTFEVYPNPTKNEFTIAVNQKHPERFNIKIQDMTGRVLYNTFFNKVLDNKTINLYSENWSPGIYLINFSNRYISKSKKLIVQ